LQRNLSAKQPKISKFEQFCWKWPRMNLDELFLCLDKNDLKGLILKIDLNVAGIYFEGKWQVERFYPIHLSHLGQCDSTKYKAANEPGHLHRPYCSHFTPDYL